MDRPPPLPRLRCSRLIRIETGRRVAAIELYACGAALALLPWLHIRLTWIAIVYAAALTAALWRRPQRAATLIALFAVPVVGAVLFFAATYVMFGTLDPTNPFRQKATGSVSSAPFGAFGLLADVEYGLLPFAPAAVFALPGIRRLARNHRITAVCASALIVGTLLISAAFVWWGGTSSPARFLVPVLPVVALCIGPWWVHAQASRASHVHDAHRNRCRPCDRRDICGTGPLSDHGARRPLHNFRVGQ